MGIIENRDAQFILLAGFIIAISLVITTALLNSIIFESTVAGEAGVDPLKYDLVNLMQVSGDEMKSAYRNATNLGGTKQNRIDNFSIQMQNFSTNLPRIYALRGEGVNVSWDVSNWNNSLYANFTDSGTASGASNWTVMESVKNISVFELRNVSTDGNFTINITNQTTGDFLWSMELYAEFTTYDDIRVYNRTGIIYNADVELEGYKYINLLNTSYYFNASVGGNSYKVSFEKGDNPYGRFKILGNTTYNRDFTRSRDYIMNSTVTLSTSRMRANITIPVSVPW